MDSEESVEKGGGRIDVQSIFDVWVAPTYESSESVNSHKEYTPPELEDSPKMKLFKEGLYSPGSGEICAKYIAMSASSVLKHPYYGYPSIKDPGIEDALVFPEEIEEYSNDGQQLYLDLCEKMNLIPVRMFYRGLVTEEIDLRSSQPLGDAEINTVVGAIEKKEQITAWANDLTCFPRQGRVLVFKDGHPSTANPGKYYGVNPVGMRAMCLALARNETVKRLDLTSNFLDHADACYHLGQMLGDRNALTELILRGCNIGSKFLRHALKLLTHRTMDLLDLSENNIRDEGFPHLTDQILHGAVIRRLNLRRNSLTSDSLSLLAEVIEFHDHTTHLDISWNTFYKTAGVGQLIRALRHSKVLVELNLSYTGLCVGVEIKGLLRIKTLKVLDISHNRLTTLASKTIAKNLIRAKRLERLDLSCNPLAPRDALILLRSMSNEKIKLKELLMDNIVVNKAFAQELKEIRNLEFRKNTVITHGYVLGNYTLPTYDIKVIYLKQLVRLMKKKKKGDGFDILGYILHQNNTREDKVLEIAEFMLTTKRAGVLIEDEFVAGLSRCFPGPRTEDKIKPLNLEMLAEYIHRYYPEKKPTPTLGVTPPEPVETKKEGGKNKKKAR